MRSWVLLLSTGCELGDVEFGAPDGAPSEVSFGMAFPIPDREAIGDVIGVDHDPVAYEVGFESAICTDHQGRAFPNCYDGHDGSDFLLIGGFDRMDSDAPVVVAAADGVVVDVRDGEYDRCRAVNFEVTCDGNPIIPNIVTLEHANGLITRYVHLLRDSVSVQIGDTVRCGDPVGRIGSSGNSSLPHLHFEVNEPDGRVIDAYGSPEGAEPLWFGLSTDDGLPEAACP